MDMSFQKIEWEESKIVNLFIWSGLCIAWWSRMVCACMHICMNKVLQNNHQNRTNQYQPANNLGKV